MKYCVAVIFLMLGAACLALWAEQTPILQAQPIRAAGEFQQTMTPAAVQERIVVWPETVGAWHLTLFLSPDWRNKSDERELVTWFTTNEQLKSLKEQAHNHFYTTDQVIYKVRYARSIPNVPAILLQDALGKVYYKVGGFSPVPRSDKQLVSDLARSIELVTGPFCPRPRPRPDPEPKPSPGPEPNVIPDMPRPVIVPDSKPVITEDKEDDSLSKSQVYGIAAALFLAIGLGTILIKAFRDKG